MVLVRRYSGVENQRTTRGRSYPGFENVKDGRMKEAPFPAPLTFYIELLIVILPM